MRFFPLLLLPFVWLGCGGDKDDDPQGSGGSGGSAQRGTAGKTEPCVSNNDCAADQARCIVAGAHGICTGALGDGAFELECKGDGTPESAEPCPGLTCLGLRANKEGKTGICSSDCTSRDDCGSKAECVPVGKIGRFCLNTCASNADCNNGFSCVSGVCLVQIN